VFTKGAIVGAVVAIPAIAGTIWLLSRSGFGDPALPLLRAVRVTTLFAGIATVLTAGGVGRLAAQVAIEGAAAGASPRRPMWVAARVFAIAGVGLTIIAAIPHGHLPDHWPGFLVIGAAGAVVGAAIGVAIGATCGGSVPLGLTDVMALARWPTEALRALLEPEDLAAAAKAGPRRRRRITIPFLFPATPPTEPPADAPAAAPTPAPAPAPAPAEAAAPPTAADEPNKP
jgi:hypothetical protein